MKTRRLFIVSTLVSIFMFLGFSHVQAQSVSDAKRLSELEIVKGDGSSYQEEASLSRAEALALILRMMEQDDVSEDLVFTDIKVSDWFYPDILLAYSMGIVDGYPDQTFRPRDSVTRNSFLKMLLETLGYEFGVDYQWEEVEVYAKVVGIIDETSGEDYTLTRGDSFSLIVNFLELAPKTSEEKYIDIMLEKDLISQEAYNSYRESNSSSIVELESVSRPKSDYVIIKLTEDVMTSQSDFTVEIQTGSTKTLVTEQVDITYYSDTVHLDLSDISLKSSDKIYCSGLIDKYNNKIEEFYFNYELSSTEIDYEFSLVSASSVGQQLIVLEFNQPISDEALKASHYKILKNNKIAFFNVEQLSDKKVVIALHETFESSDLMEVIISGGMKDIYSNIFLDGISMTYDVVIDSENIDKLQILSIKSLGSGVIRIVFNQPLDDRESVNRLNYEVSDLSRGSGYRTVSKVIATGSGDLIGRQFDVSFKESVDGNLYYFKVVDMPIIGNTSLLEQQQKLFTYVEQTNVFKVTSVTVFDSQHIRLNLSHNLTQSQVDDANIKVNGIISYRNRVGSNNMSVDVYTKNPFEENKNYSVNIEGLTSSLGLVLATGSASFTSSEIIRGEVNTEVTYLSNKNLLVTFDQPIKALYEESFLRIYKLSQEGISTQLEVDDYKIVDETTFLIYNNSIDIESYILYDVYLYGDDFYVGSLVIDLN